MGSNWMAKSADATKSQLRLSPVTKAYIKELARIGIYGKGESGVMRSFIEAGIRRALENKVIAAKSVDDFTDDESEEVQV